VSDTFALDKKLRSAILALVRGSAEEGMTTGEIGKAVGVGYDVVQRTLVKLNVEGVIKRGNRSGSWVV